MPTSFPRQAACPFLTSAATNRSWPLIFHVHGLLYFGWVLFFWWQNWLIMNGQPLRHRAWGLFGIALGTAMVCAAFALVATRAAE